MGHCCDFCRYERQSEFRRINAGFAAVPEACHYLCDVSSDHAAADVPSASAELQWWEIDGDGGKEERLIWAERISELGESW